MSQQPCGDIRCSVRSANNPQNIAERRSIVLGIALQTQVLQTCSIHDQVFAGDEASMARTFAHAVELLRERKLYVREFNNDVHQLTELLSDTIGAAPESCLQCHLYDRPSHSVAASSAWRTRP